MNVETRAARKIQALARPVYEEIVREALAEDFGLGGDITSEAVIPAGTRARASLVARRSGVLAGLDPALLAFRLLDPEVLVDIRVRDGEVLAPNQTIAILTGDARALLGAERTALNLLSHLSGIATATADCVGALGDAKCTVCETRKTLPGLRALQKYAVRAGGGTNHRFRLDDAILIKDNHIAAAGGIGPALAAARLRAGPFTKIEIELDDLEQLDQLLLDPEGVDAVLLDNFSPADLRTAVRRIGGRFITEASGGVTLHTLPEIAATGVDMISVGALTHSVIALDIGLDFTPLI